MKTAPFDLDKALAGHPLVTRDGSLVSGFKFTDREPLFPYEALVDGYGVESFTEKGTVYYAGDDPNDLFLYLGEDEPEEEAPALSPGLEQVVARLEAAIAQFCEALEKFSNK